MEQAQASLRDLRMNLRRLQRQAARIRKSAQVVHSPTMLLRLRAVLLFVLCDNMHWTLLWATWFQERQRGIYATWRQPLTEAMLSGWVREFQQHHMVQEALRALDHPWRLVADTFLIESLVYEDVLKSNAKGLQVPSPALVQWYIHKWSLRPHATCTANLLLKLKADGSYARLWACRFRKRWSLRWGMLQEVRNLSRESTKKRAAIYLRWMKWATSQPCGSAGVVIVAMDETAVASVMSRGMMGAIVHRRQQGDLRVKRSPSKRQLGRTALIAAVCNDAALQPHLPQVWLPRTTAKNQPPPSLQAVFTQAGSPHEAWHGSHGFCTHRIVLAWLRRVRRKVLMHRPGARLIVVMDVCPAHVAPALLAGARRLHIDVVLVPARMTWLLQLLDTHVFAQLKREMRTLLWAARQRHEDGALGVAEHLKALLEATSNVLTRRAWNHLFPRVGLDGSTDALRPGLRALVHDEDLSARPPTEEELAEVLGAHRKNVSHVHRLLLQGQNTADAVHSEGDPGSAGDHSLTPEETDPILAPLLTQEIASGPSGAPSQNTSPAPALARPVPRGRRLLPCTRNLRILAPPPEAPEHRVTTRSQKRPLVQGVVGAEKRSRAETGNVDSQS